MMFQSGLSVPTESVAITLPPLNSHTPVAPIIVVPEDVAGVVAVNIGGVGNVPVGAHRSQSRRCDHIISVELPDAERAVVVAPENVAHPVAVEVTGTRDVPV